jgi:endonuclease I/V8-like Glu-specific endopeptidase
MLENLKAQIRNCEYRYVTHQKERQLREEQLKLFKEEARKVDWRKIDSPERMRTRLERQGLGEVVSEIMADFSTTEGIPKLNVLERIIAENELMGINFLLKGGLISRSISRVVILNPFGSLEGFGTGFMVSPRLLLTNNHVLENALSASNSIIQFNYYETSPGNITTPIAFMLEPNVFFQTDEELDFTLVAVNKVNPEGVAVKDLGWNPLIRESGKAVVGERVNIIQHPGGEPMQLSLRQNQIIDVLEQFLHYKTDTQPGSSGSPVLNDQWEVAALHHAGVPERNSSREIMLVTGVPWDGTEATIPLISWIANEGVRISKIVQFIEAQSLSIEEQRLFAEAFVAPPVTEVVANKNSASDLPASSSSQTNPQIEPDGSVSWLFKVNFAPAGLSTPVSEPKTSTKSPTVPSIPATSTDISPQQLPKLQAAQKVISDSEFTIEPYYDADKDQDLKQEYYQDIDPNVSASKLFDDLHDLLKNTHRNKLSYKEARWEHLYPKVDRHENGELRNIYSGTPLDPVEVLRQEMVLVEKFAPESMQLLEQHSFTSEEERLEYLDFLESDLAFNCEHVVPQSWFDKDNPMRGDLHHLFTCEPKCNSFRSNIPYFQFSPLEEKTMSDCGRREENKFEPQFSRGIVARATLYFLLRYPKEVQKNEMPKDRLEILKKWHKTYPVERYEYHRNATIASAQGNRNPLIDFPEWIDKIDFSSSIN